MKVNKYYCCTKCLFIYSLLYPLYFTDNVHVPKLFTEVGISCQSFCPLSVHKNSQLFNQSDPNLTNLTLCDLPNLTLFFVRITVNRPHVKVKLPLSHPRPQVSHGHKLVNLVTNSIAKKVVLMNVVG